MSASAIEFQNVTKVYQRRFSSERVAALTDVSFEVASGEVCAFLGPSGAGKTTSISILIGFLFGDSGKVRVLGYEPGTCARKSRLDSCPRISRST
jgi:ABC-2 type transport system ATP-binding protein